MKSQLAALVSTARPAQWMKNVVVLAPLIFAQRLTDGGDVLRAVAMFAIFCALASGVYFVNDAVDAERDRRNPHKKGRPVAAGRLSRATAVATGVVLGALAVGLSALLGVGVVIVLGSYFALNVVYSLWLSRVAFLDGMAVAAGFVLRAIAGAVAISVPFSGWLILCTFLLTLLISLGKRRAELTQPDAQSRGLRRTWNDVPREVVDAVIVLVGATVVVCYAIYSLAPETAAQFGGRGLVFTVPFVLYGITRFMLRAFSGEGVWDPTTVLLQDRGVQAAVAGWLAASLLIIYWAGTWLSELVS